MRAINVNAAAIQVMETGCHMIKMLATTEVSYAHSSEQHMKLHTYLSFIDFKMILSLLNEDIFLLCFLFTSTFAMKPSWRELVMT